MEQAIFPPYLKEGDKVIIVSPSGKMDKTLLKNTKQCLESWGLTAEISKNAGKSFASYAGTVDQRTEDFQAAMDDKDARAIFCSRGGYGAVHIIDKLNFDHFKESPKWLIGFSDISALHALFQYNGYASLHAPMGRHICVEPANDPSTNLLKNILFGHLPEYCIHTHKLNKPGEAKGILRGGNLAVFYGLRGTPYDLPDRDTLLFMEDVGERPHAIERMVYNLKLGGVLEQLSGLIIGQFTEFEEDKSLGKVLYGALADVLKGYDFPVCFDFPVGHVTDNYPLICGAQAEFSVDKKAVRLKFTAS